MLSPLAQQPAIEQDKDILFTDTVSGKHGARLPLLVSAENLLCLSTEYAANRQMIFIYEVHVTRSNCSARGNEHAVFLNTQPLQSREFGLGYITDMNPLALLSLQLLSETQGAFPSASFSIPDLGCLGNQA